MSEKFETLKSVRHLARPEDWMISFDLEDGYHAIGIHPKHQKYMTFSLNGQLYSCASLPFGWSGSPAVFCRVMKVLTQTLRSPDLVPTARGPNTPEPSGGLLHMLKRRGVSSPQQLRILPYMDDYLAFFPSREEALRGRRQIELTLEYLGLSRNPKKGDWEPTQRLNHLGLTVDTLRGVFMLPPAKEAKIKQMARGLKAQAFRNRRLLPARLIAQFTGLCQSVYLACPAARLYLRALHDCLRQKRSWSDNVRL